MSTSQSNGRVLLVDDDPISLSQVEMLVQIEGFEVVAVDNPLEALRVFGRDTVLFDVILTDYTMPEIDGLVLMERAHKIDSTLAVVIITSDTERATLSASIRKGAADFLEKPVNRSHIRDSLTRAVAKTREQRVIVDAANRLSTVKTIQQRLSPSFSKRTSKDQICTVTTCLHPIHEAGGDFLSIYTDEESHFAIALGDISGHGVKEGFIGAYFQGLVKGLFVAGMPNSRVAEECNRFLIHNWNSQLLEDVSTSLSVAIVRVDLASMKLDISNYGCPAPMFFLQGECPRPLATSGSPLGWFDSPEGTEQELDIPETGSCLLWSDGLPDTADRLKVSPYALATRVLTDHSLPDLGEVPDDILVARIDWHRLEDRAPDNLPVICERFRGDSAGEVDQIDIRVKASVSLAVAGILDETLDQIVLCTREAMLNAMNHGCKGSPDLTVKLLMEFFARTRVLRVRVEDPGDGYEPMLPVTDQEIDSPLDLGIEGHISLGLQVIRSLANEVRLFRHGATIEMDFVCLPRPDEGWWPGVP